MNATDLLNTTVLREAAQRMKPFGFVILKFVKGRWLVADNEINNTELVARPDWTMRGWIRFWDSRPTAYHLGYVVDRYVPPARETLGDNDKTLWEIYCKGRDPWSLQWHLPFYNPTSGEQLLWSTDTKGGEACIGDLLTAFCDRVDLRPEDETTLPRVLLSSGGYNHPTHKGFVATPQLDILGWVRTPLTARPTLPVPPPPPPSSLPPPEASAPHTLIEDLDIPASSSAPRTLTGDSDSPF